VRERRERKKERREKRRVCERREKGEKVIVVCVLETRDNVKQLIWVRLGYCCMCLRDKK